VVPRCFAFIGTLVEGVVGDCLSYGLDFDSICENEANSTRNPNGKKASLSWRLLAEPSVRSSKGEDFV